MCECKVETWFKPRTYCFDTGINYRLFQKLNLSGNGVALIKRLSLQTIHFYIGASLQLIGVKIHHIPMKTPKRVNNKTNCLKRKELREIEGW